MGQGSSSLPTSLPQYALHCLRVAPSSPAHGHLEPFFDYLVGVDTNSESDVNAQLEEGLSPLDLGRVLESNEGKPIGLRVYNAKSQRIRGESYLCLWSRKVRGHERNLDQGRDAGADGRCGSYTE